MTFDEAIDWCLKHNIEIDPEGPDKAYKIKGLTRLQYCFFDKEKNENIRVVKTANSLVEVVEEMKKEIGENPEAGFFMK